MQYVFHDLFINVATFLYFKLSIHAGSLSILLFFSEHTTKGDVLPLDEEAVNDMGVFHQGQTIGSFNSLAEAEVDTEEKLKFF